MAICRAADSEKCVNRAITVSWGERLVHDYRVYCVDKIGKITTASWIEADSVEHAVEIVRDTHKGVDCEIWEGTQCLAKVPAVSPAA